MKNHKVCGKFPLTEEQKNRVAEARAEFAAGKSVSGDKLMKDVEKWLLIDNH